MHKDTTSIKKIISIIFFVQIVFTSCQKYAVPEPFINNNTVAQTMNNLRYGTDSKQRIDLYLPANRSKTKTLILVHGGGWIEGDKSDMTYLIPILQQYLPEYAIANINYRLATTTKTAIPMQLDDLNSVFVKLKNENYGISDDFGFIGTSEV